MSLVTSAATAKSVVERAASPRLMQVDQLEPIRVPAHVLLSGGVVIFGGGIPVLHWVLGSGTQPLVHLCMTVSEGEPAGAVMIGGRNIFPVGGRRVGNKKPVVDRIRMLIEGDPGHCRRGDVTLFQELAITRKTPALAGFVAWIRGLPRFRLGVSKESIHRVTPESAGETRFPLCGTHIDICRAFVNAERG